MTWELFLYRLPSEPSRARVAVWRELRRLGALPLASAVVAVPVTEPFRGRLDAVAHRVESEGGSFYRFPLSSLDANQRARLQEEWNQLRVHEYGEIVEECNTKFLKEIEFEIFRDNLTSGEAEEIEADLDKIKQWFTRIQERDLFGAAGRKEAVRAIKHCEAAFDDFVHRVYAAETADGPITALPEAMPWGEMPDGTAEPAQDRPEKRRKGGKR
ncbi:MAG: Chromate resistance protein ChrB [Gaiellales bacterium]